MKTILKVKRASQLLLALGFIICACSYLYYRFYYVPEIRIATNVNARVVGYMRNVKIASFQEKDKGSYYFNCESDVSEDICSRLPFGHDITIVRIEYFKSECRVRKYFDSSIKECEAIVKSILKESADGKLENFSYSLNDSIERFALSKSIYSKLIFYMFLIGALGLSFAKIWYSPMRKNSQP